MNDLPMVRSHELIDYGRCPKKWYWKWRMGLVPKTEIFSALSLGTWVHAALAEWYELPRSKRTVLALVEAYKAIVYVALHGYNGPTHVLDQGHELAALGLAMVTGYAKHYGNDPDLQIIATEIPIEFEITHPDGELIAIYKLKPDAVFQSRKDGFIWLLETKTAASIRVEHLPIDSQARPYATLAERALKTLGAIKKTDSVKGILYNFLRKAHPDERDYNKQGLALNKDGSVSKRQPSPLFVRHPLKLTRAAKRIALERLKLDSLEITTVAEYLRQGRIKPSALRKTTHHSCPKTCQYFSMCVLEEEGGDITEMRRTMYRRENPYEYYEETTTEPASFEMG